MAMRGYSLTDYSWLRYVFEETEPNKYSYCIEYLPANPHSLEGKAYIKFLEESEIECISTYMNWAYFRKETSKLKETDGKLIIYSDCKSQMSHIKRILLFYLPLMLMNLPIGLTNLIHGIAEKSPFLVFIGGLNIFLSFMLFCIAFPYVRQYFIIRKKRRLIE